MIVEFIPSAGNGFVGRVSIREMQAYSEWMRRMGFQWRGRSWQRMW